jgi:hypothetical protein
LSKCKPVMLFKYLIYSSEVTGRFATLI